ncbi:hypothetical protein BBJ28_00009194 [Nothophytophthora sp. Chile5]|nr:hypothetical protein BBJ28_00009194 [Nothophytophthora sp. Chile5]
MLLLAAAAVVAVQASSVDSIGSAALAVGASSERSLLELEQLLLASTELQDGQRRLSISSFEEHAARHLLAVASVDTTKEATALFKLYKKLYPKVVAAWGTSYSAQYAYFYANVFPKIQAKAKKLLADASSSGTTGSTTAGSTTASGGSSSGSTSWVTATYDSALSSTVTTLSSTSSSVETVVESASGSSSSSSSTSAYTAPTVVDGYTSPSRRFLASGSSSTSSVDVLFCDIEGNAIWKWSAEDIPDATVSNSSSGVTTIDVSADGVCSSSTTTLTVSAYQTGCSLQNHPEGCDNVYYKGCGGLTVSPTSDRIVVARTGGRTLGVLSYKSVGSACQGQVVDAISTYRGKKFNSPTYAEFANSGVLYFTDSPFGLATSDADLDGDTLDNSPLREIPFNGVYMLRNGSSEAVELVDCEMTRPNKIAFSPEQDVMYVTNSQKGNSYVNSYSLLADGSANSSSVFFNFTAHPELETADGYAKGIKVDDSGFVYVVCYKGVYIFSPEGVLAGAVMSSEELDSVSMGLGRLFITGSFGIVAQTNGVASQALAQAQTTCSA